MKFGIPKIKLKEIKKNVKHNQREIDIKLLRIEETIYEIKERQLHMLETLNSFLKVVCNIDDEIRFFRNIINFSKKEK